MEHKDFKSCLKGFKGFRDDEKMILDQIISTEERDDGGDVMVQDGMIERGEVVVLYQHGQDPVVGTRPIGKPLGFRKEMIGGVKCTIARMQYYDGSKLPVPDNLGRLLYDMDSKGFLPNNSIGYTAVEEMPDANGRTVKKWTLHEFSKVNIGMNQGAITLHNLGGKLEFKFVETKEKNVLHETSGPSVISALQERFDELMNPKPSQKENKDMENLAKSGEQCHHKALHVIHSALIKDLKEEACKSGDASIDSEKIAKKCFKEYGEMALPHVEKYIKAVKAKEKPDDEDDEDGESDEKNLKEAGHKIAHKAMKMAHKAMIEQIHSFAGKKDTDHEKEAAGLIAEHEKVALPHAKDFVEKWAEAQKAKTIGGIDLKSIQGNIAHQSAQTNMRMIHDGMVSECYNRAYDDKETDSETIADQVSKEAADLHKPHLKAICDKVRTDNPKDIGEYQKKNFSSTATNPAETVETKDKNPDSLPVEAFVKEFSVEQAAPKPDFVPAGFMDELKAFLPQTIKGEVEKAIRKAQGRID